MSDLAYFILEMIIKAGEWAWLLIQALVFLAAFGGGLALLWLTMEAL